MDRVLAASCCVAHTDTPTYVHTAKHLMNACACIRQIKLHISISLCLLPFVGFEESGVSDAEGLLAMMHHRYPDVREGEGGGIVHVMRV